ncbi:MAG: hypothetical protein LBK27_08400 [Treponema sp.]|jgi:hypothetical protein|nr:hypothetical protein [Treponema sp.]
MKRFTALFILLSGLGAALFSLEFSAGGGLTVLPYQEGLSVKAPGYKTGHIVNHWADWGVYAFFDVQYFELDIGYYRAFYGDYEWADFGSPMDFKFEYDNIDVSYFDFGLLLKYPLKLSRNIAITPMIGFSYWTSIQADYGYKTLQDAAWDARKEEWDQMWIKLGLGLDTDITKNLYLRFTGKLAFPLPTDEWERREKNVKQLFGLFLNGAESDFYGVGAEFSLALGFKFN